MSTRDHSWGVRYDVGTPPTDVDPFDPVSEMDFQMIWCPVLMADPDGTQWGLFMHLVDLRDSATHHRTVTGAVEHAGRAGSSAWPTSGRSCPSTRSNRRLLGGEVAVTLEDGPVRRFELEVPTATGFHLGAGPLLRMAGPPSRRMAG